MTNKTTDVTILSPDQLLNGRNLVVIANREPFQIQRNEHSVRLEKTTGGLVSALSPVLESCNGLWVCWDGSSEGDPSFEDLVRLAQLNNIPLPYRVNPVQLTEDEVKHYYYGFANRQIWPLMHYFPSRYKFDENDWGFYREVNRKFARAVVEACGPEDLIWVQDYHLMMVPQYVREIRERAHLAFFCHIPFPHYEVFRMLPTRREILAGMLGSDIIGFHTPNYAQYFMECAEALLPGRVRLADSQTLLFEDREIRVKPFPISIDYEAIDTLAATPEMDEAVKQLRSTFQPAEFIGLGVDRLDYTKGILERLECIELFLQRHPEYRKRLVFIQIAVPSRTRVQEYQQMKQEIDEAVGRINGRFSEEGWAPIHYLYRGFPMEELVAYYKAADFALVNPLRDGMNLVAKEYCAAQTEQQGALILSELTGAAYQLKDSFLVNPHDQPGVVEAIYSALNTPIGERKRRMAELRRGIRHDNIEKWRNDFLNEFTDVANKRP